MLQRTAMVMSYAGQFQEELFFFSQQPIQIHPLFLEENFTS